MLPLALKTHPYSADSTYSQRQVNTLRPGQNGHNFVDDIIKCIFLNENVWIPIKISLKFVPKGLINNIPALVRIMAWCRPGDKPLSEPMMVRLPTHICVTRPQWFKSTAFINDSSPLFQQPSVVTAYSLEILPIFFPIVHSDASFET